MFLDMNSGVVCAENYVIFEITQNEMTKWIREWIINMFG